MEESLSRDEEPSEDCLVEFRRATNKLDKEGFWWRPSWANLRGGHRAPDIDQGEFWRVASRLARLVFFRF